MKPSQFAKGFQARPETTSSEKRTALDRLNGRPYATLICAGSDGRSAAQQIERIATGWRLKPIADPIIVCTHAQTPEAILRPKHIADQDLKPCAELGATLASGMALGIF